MFDKKEQNLYPPRWRIFLGFLIMAFLALFNKKNSHHAAEILALGLSERERLERERKKEMIRKLNKMKKGKRDE